MTPPGCVVKVGGSLADAAMWDGRLARWLQQEPHRPVILVTGGGDHADAIRDLDALGGLTALQAHRLAIRAMSLNAWVLHHDYPGWRWEQQMDRLRTRISAGDREITIVDPASWLEEHQRHVEDAPPRIDETELEPLPIGWHVTSDSIAAYLTRWLGLDELVLLKRCAPPSAEGPNQVDDNNVSRLKVWAEQAYVDRHFPMVAHPIRIVRAVSFT